MARVDNTWLHLEFVIFRISVDSLHLHNVLFYITICTFLQFYILNLCMVPWNKHNKIYIGL